MHPWQMSPHTRAAHSDSEDNGRALVARQALKAWLALGLRVALGLRDCRCLDRGLRETSAQLQFEKVDGESATPECLIAAS